MVVVRWRRGLVWCARMLPLGCSLSAAVSQHPCGWAEAVLLSVGRRKPFCSQWSALAAWPNGPGVGFRYRRLQVRVRGWCSRKMMDLSSS